MRLFIAINFSNTVKEKISEIIDELERSSSQGRFVSQEHQHLTLEFLGEVEEDRVTDIKRIMDKLDFDAFDLRLFKIGHFKRPQGNIYWIGIRDNDSLMKLQSFLHSLLKEDGFKLEDRPYKPHITLGRKVKLKENINFSSIEDKIKNILIPVDKIDLMKSETINGKLKYSVIYSKDI